MSKLRDRFAIVGVGVTPTIRSHAPGVSGLALEAWATRIAIEDAGLRRRDIDGSIHAMMASPHPPAQWTDAFSRALGLRPNFYLNVARGGQAAHNGILLATQTLGLGLAKYVSVSCGLPGWSAAHSKSGDLGVSSSVGVSMNDFLHHGLGVLGYDAAASGAASGHAYLASRHMHEYGTTAEQLGAVAVSARAWANLNPEARFYGRTLTIQNYLESPMIVSPLRRADCCIQSDLGVSLVLTTAERAKDLDRPVVYIKGLGLGDQARKQWWDKTNYTELDGAFAARSALAEANVELADIDLAQFYDCFTTEMIFYAEAYGLCKRGEGGEFAASGAYGPGGSFPANTYGGLLSGSYLFDFPGVAEAVRQLRGEAGVRQVPHARLAMTNGHGGEMVMPGMCSSHATMVLGAA
jgi:acetyl-CoA acetyltransferase